MHVNTHRVTLTGKHNKYNIYFDPLMIYDHKYTLIFLHGRGDSALDFYRWIIQVYPHFFGIDPTVEKTNKKQYDFFKHARIVILNDYEGLDKLKDDFHQKDLRLAAESLHILI